MHYVDRVINNPLFRPFIFMMIFSLPGCATPSQPTATLIGSDTPVPMTIVVQASTTPLPTSEPSPTSTPSRLFTDHFVSDDPVIAKGAAGAWDDGFVSPNGALFVNGMYYLFYKGFGVGDSHGTNYATSPDGRHWTRAGTESLFTDLDLGLNFPGLVPSSVLSDNGQWVMYAWGIQPGGAERFVIWRATAPAPGGPWSVDPQPVLEPGPNGSWDSTGVELPSVVKNGDTYLMLYDGFTSAQPGRDSFGLATSSDGIHWLKYNDSETNQALYAESDPVFAPGESGAFDGRSVQVPRMVQTANGFMMMYIGIPRIGEDSALGLATSADGIHWQRYAANPILTPEDIPGHRLIHKFDLLYAQDKFYVFVEALGQSDSNIWLAVIDDTIATTDSTTYRGDARRSGAYAAGAVWQIGCM